MKPIRHLYGFVKKDYLCSAPSHFQDKDSQTNLQNEWNVYYRWIKIENLVVIGF